MDGYGAESYGAAFADVYDEWYHDVSDVAATVEFLSGLAPQRGRLLELGVGTGRLALPLSAAGFDVIGVDASDAMLARLEAADTADAVTIVRGDMVDDLPEGSFDAALIAFNTLFNIVTAHRQQQLFAEIAQRLSSTGCFVVETFVPDTEHYAGDRIDLRSMERDRVVLSVSRHDNETQRAEGQFIELSNGAPVKLRPWSIRWATPEQLDEMAHDAGLRLDRRVADMRGTPFDDDATTHVSVYRPI
ncbi:MAG: class I SAM-dependent methyltransferase [Ilumatobacteraceae bacterium]|nr:class I SAM-dependent methyltransferase [Ilumatobacteraceae bacterium]